MIGPPYRMFTDFLNVHGPEKRKLLNSFSIWIAGAAALSSGFTGCFVAIENFDVGIVPAWIIGFFVGTFAFSIAANWLAGDRFFRP